MLLLFPVFLALGLFVPGFFLAKYLRQPLAWAGGFVISLVVLFHSIFWLGILHVPLTVWTVAPCLAAATAAAAVLWRRSAAPAKKPAAPVWEGFDRVLLAGCVVVAAAVLARSAISPLIGFDAPWRWDFLAQRIFALGRFDFYPPLTPADFRTYFYVDGIPPLVSFTNFWLYASAGQYLPALICIFVAAQFVTTLAFTYGAAASIFSQRAGVLAAAMLAACPLFLRSLVLGQDTGLTALAIAAMVYYIAASRHEDSARSMVAAGLAAAVCALSREYGWIAVIAGAVAILWRRLPVRQAAIFAGVAAAAAGPWYVRSWVVAGNPFYSLSLGGFAVNEIHAGIMQYYKLVLGPQLWTVPMLKNLGLLLLLYATLQVLAGIPGIFRRFRETGYLSVIAVMLAGVWALSSAYTSAGILLSTRVLSPVMVLLSVAAATLAEPWMRRAGWRVAALVVLLVLQAWTIGHAVFYPNTPLEIAPGQWLQYAFRRNPDPVEFQVRDQFAAFLPAGSRMLSENAGLHAALADKGIDVVPVWSPEVRFLFSATPEEAERQLRALHIESAALYPESLNTQFLVQVSPFYAALPQRWRSRARVPGSFHLLVAPPAQ